jgi:ABC-2 type transport system permease protein
MNTAMIGILVRKDLRLLQMPVLFYFLIGVLAVGLLGLPHEASFYAGMVLLVTTLMGLGMHPVMATTVSERKEKTLTFIMSMPIKPTDYTCAKLLANVLLFFVPWTLLLLATVAIIAARPSMPNGLIPMAVILFGIIAVGAQMNLCIALITESVQLTIATQVLGNMVFQSVMYAAGNNASIKATMHGATAVWSGDALLFVGLEIVATVLLFATALWRQSRKTDFI